MTLSLIKYSIRASMLKFASNSFSEASLVKTQILTDQVILDVVLSHLDCSLRIDLHVEVDILYVLLQIIPQIPLVLF